jgi:hypothetical protein
MSLPGGGCFVDIRRSTAFIMLCALSLKIVIG